MLLMTAMIAGGAFAGSLRTTLVEAPKLGAAVTTSVTGRVIDREDARRGPRIVLEVHDFGQSRVGGQGDREFPHRVRVAIPAASQVKTGDVIEAKVRLFPPAGPVRPGGYDFSFRAYFEKIGATGFTYGAPEILRHKQLAGVGHFSRWLDDLRGSLSISIGQLLGATDAGALAIALLIGDRAGLSEDTEEALRAAGLAHVLAISGLHMALFAGGAFSGVLLVLGCVEAVALRWPTHKIAAIVALASATAYLAISGASIATQRSFLMIALVFLGILVSRKGLSLHSVALAAMVLLVLAPERLVHPGFQMSFAAVICLIAVYQRWRDRQQAAGWSDDRSSQALWWRVFRKSAGFVAGLAATALIAGIATGIIGAYHFGRYAPLGLVGNVLAMPIFSLMVMPIGVLALFLLPFGLALYPLKLMAFGLDMLLAIARWTAELDQGQGYLVPPSGGVTLLMVSAMFVLVLFGWRSQAIISLPILLLASFLHVMGRPPDIQLSSDGVAIAARDELGRLKFSSGRDSFETQMWLQAEGEGRAVPASLKMARGQRLCDGGGCVVKAWPAAGGHEGPVLVALPETPEAMAADCDIADIIVSDLIAPIECGAGFVVDGGVRARHGAVAIWLNALPGHKRDQETRGRRGDEREMEPVDPKALPYAIEWKGALSFPARPWHR